MLFELGGLFLCGASSRTQHNSVTVGALDYQSTDLIDLLRNTGLSYGSLAALHLIQKTTVGGSLKINVDLVVLSNLTFSKFV